jgi:ankyrin
MSLAPLHLAVLNQEVRLTEALLQNGANPNVQTLRQLESSFKGFAKAVCLCDIDFSFFLDFPTLFFAEQQKFRTALHCAAAMGNKHLVKLLLSHRADPTLQDEV